MEEGENKHKANGAPRNNGGVRVPVVHIGDGAMTASAQTGLPF